MATPAIEVAILLRVKENAPAVPATIAIPKSIKLGEARTKISDLTVSTESNVPIK